MASKSYQQSGHERTKHIGFTAKILNWLVGLPVVLTLTILFSVAVEWVGMNTLWKEQGVKHAHNMLVAEANYLNKHFTESILGSSPLEAAKVTVGYVNRKVFVPLGIDSYKRNTNLSGFERVVWEHVLAAYYILNVILIRLCVLLFSVPVYLLFAVVGFVTGLVERDLRRFGAGRESSDRYEISRKFIYPSISLCFVIYLSWPNSLSPSLVIVPFATFFGWAIHLTVSNYKKYL